MLLCQLKEFCGFSVCQTMLLKDWTEGISRIVEWKINLQLLVGHFQIQTNILK